MSELDECHCDNREAHIAMLQDRIDNSEPTNMGNATVTDEEVRYLAEVYSPVLLGEPTLLDNVNILTNPDMLATSIEQDTLTDLREQVQELSELDDETLADLPDYVWPNTDIAMFRRWIAQIECA